MLSRFGSGVRLTESIMAKFKAKEETDNQVVKCICSYLILFGERLVASLLGALEVCAVLPGQVPPEGGEGEHDGDVTHVTLVLGGLLLLLLDIARLLRSRFSTIAGLCLLSQALLGLSSLCVGLFPMLTLLVMCFIVMSEILFVLEHFITIFALKQIVVFMPLFMTFTM